MENKMIKVQLNNWTNDIWNFMNWLFPFWKYKNKNNFVWFINMHLNVNQWINRWNDN